VDAEVGQSRTLRFWESSGAAFPVGFHIAEDLDPEAQLIDVDQLTL